MNSFSSRSVFLELLELGRGPCLIINEVIADVNQVFVNRQECHQLLVHRMSSQPIQQQVQHLQHPDA